MSKFTTYANDILDMGYGGWAAAGYTAGTTSIVQIGGTPYTFPIKTEFTTTVSVAGTPGTPFSGGSYPAGGITHVGAFATTGAASASKTNGSGAIGASNMPAGTWADVYTHDSTGTPKPMNFRGGASLAKTVNVGDTCSIPTSNYTATET
jgi:hypothetical protein